MTKLLEKQNAAHLSLRKKTLPSYFPKERIILLDDFQELPPLLRHIIHPLCETSDIPIPPWGDWKRGYPRFQ